MSELKLLNCPFCGGKAEFVKMGIAKDIPLGFVRCTECGIRLRQGNCTEEFARDEWNRRTPMANIVEKLEEKTEFLKDCTKYGNESPEQQEKSYSTMMMYEVAGLVDDLIDIVKQEINNGLE